MMKIEKLTPEQEKRMIAFRQEWMNHGLCTDPAAFDKAEEAIAFFYQKMGKGKPLFFRFSSPLMCEFGAVALKVLLGEKNFSRLESQLGSQLRSQLEGQLWSQLGSQLWSQLGSQLESQLRSQLRSQLESQLRSQLESQLEGQLRSQLGSQLRSQLEGQLRSQLWSQLWSQLESQLGSQLESQLGSQLGSQLEGQLRSQLRSQLESQLGSQLWSQLGSQLWSQLESQLGSQLESQLEGQLRSQLRSQQFLYNSFGGQHAAAWKAFYLFCHEIGVKYGADDLAILNAWGAIAQSCCWWSPWEGICIISDRPRHVSFDVNGRLHNETGMAVRFSDGWGVHAWHGVRIPGWIVEQPKKITLKKIEAEQNAEIRRVMMNKYGIARYFEDSGAQEVDRDRDTKGERILYRKKDSVGNIQIIKLENSTPERDGSKKFYTFRVPPDVKTCQEAVAYLYSRNPKRYNPIVES